jgi:hypothetical protein
VAEVALELASLELEVHTYKECHIFSKTFGNFEVKKSVYFIRRDL